MIELIQRKFSSGLNGVLELINDDIYLINSINILSIILWWRHDISTSTHLDTTSSFRNIGLILLHYGQSLSM